MKAMPALVAMAMLLLLLQDCPANASERSLVAELMRRLGPEDKIARPESGFQGNVNVTVGLSLLRVVSLQDEAADLFVWLKMTWKDRRLSWDPRSFGGIRSVALPMDSVWVPDIRPYDAMEYKPDRESTGQVAVSNDGFVVQVLPARVKVECGIARNGSALCRMRMGSWVYNGFQVQPHLEGQGSPFDLHYYRLSREWEVFDASAKIREETYECCPEPYFTITYTLRLNPKLKRSIWS